jgi:hypothetical protein
VRRAGIFLAPTSVMLLIAFAGVALAAFIEGDDEPNALEGTPRPTPSSTATAAAPTASEVGAAPPRCASAAGRTKATAGLATTASAR